MEEQETERGLLLYSYYSMRVISLIVLALLVVLSLQKGVDGQEQAVTLESLSDEQIKQAVESMDDSNLMEIITSAGYTLDESQEKPTREELVQAAVAITLEQKHKILEEKGGASSDTTTSQQATTAGAIDPVGGDILADSGDDAPSGHGEPLIEELDNGVEEAEENEESDYPQAELARKLGQPDDAGFWTLFKAQVISDFAPFWKVVPAPVKNFIQDQTQHLKPAVVAVAGATGPMLGILSKFVSATGHGLVRLSEEMEVWSRVAKEKHEASKGEPFKDGNGGYPNGDSWWVDKNGPEMVEL